ncbi:MAG: hypothetical protein P8173_05170 [Gammaproteobacteria bacterium]
MGDDLKIIIGQPDGLPRIIFELKGGVIGVGCDADNRVRVDPSLLFRRQNQAGRIAWMRYLTPKAGACEKHEEQEKQNGAR